MEKTCLSIPIMLFLFALVLLIQPVLGGGIEIAGKFQTFGAVYLQGKLKNNERFFGTYRFLPKLSLILSDNLLIHFEGDLRQDTEGYAQGVLSDIAERDGKRWEANIMELYVDYDKEWFRLRIGKQIYDWSLTDIISPTDNISP